MNHIIVLNDENGDIDVYNFPEDEKREPEEWLEEVQDINTNHVTWMLVPTVKITFY